MNIFKNSMQDVSDRELTQVEGGWLVFHIVAFIVIEFVFAHPAYKTVPPSDGSDVFRGDRAKG